MGSLLAFLTGVGLGITFLVELGGEALELRSRDLAELRIGVIATAYAAALLGGIAFLACVAAYNHVMRSRGSLRGGGWAAAGLVLSLAPMALAFLGVLPHYAKIHKETAKAKESVEGFRVALRREDWGEAHKSLSPDDRRALTPEDLRRMASEAGFLSDSKYLRARSVIVSSSLDRGEVDLGEVKTERIRLVREGSSWRISLGGKGR